MTSSRFRRSLVVLLALFAFAAFPSSSSADHSWGNYHWARTSNLSKLKITVIDSMTSDWDDNLYAGVELPNPDGDASTITISALTIGTNHQSSKLSEKRATLANGHENAAQRSLAKFARATPGTAVPPGWAWRKSG